MKDAGLEESYPVLKEEAGPLFSPSFALAEVFQHDSTFKSFHCEAVTFVQDIVYCYGTNRIDGVADQALVTYDYRRGLFAIPGANSKKKSKAGPEGLANCTIVRRRPANGAASAEVGVVTTFGGEIDSKTKTDKLWNFDPVAIKWDQVKAKGGTKPSPRTGHAACSSLDFTRMFVYGGLNENGQAESDCFVLTETDEWKPLSTAGAAEGPPARVHHTLTCGRSAKSSREKLLLFGGSSSGSGSGSNDLWIYDLKEEAWREVRDASGAPPRCRLKHAAAFADYRMWICGGVTRDWLRHVDLTDLHGYDIAANCWFACDVSLRVPRRQSITGTFGPAVVSPATQSVIVFGRCEEQSTVYCLAPLCTIGTITKVEEENHSAQDEIKEIFSSLQLALANTAKIGSSVSKVHQRVERAHAELDEVTKKLDACKAELSRTEKKGEEARAEILKRTDTLSEAITQLEKLSERFATLEKSIPDILRKLDAKVDKLEVAELNRALEATKQLGNLNQRNGRGRNRGGSTSESSSGSDLD
ncbi:kelch repeat-containing protein [Cystoisospora suis]|uniref:Kelch repeat-containing protein n=1 Tax=Cystoisospora suis TaxID=483139 RepID=A0A2C6L926_9APIC|nr:kelch repeat-containing protein [Cystoisospora suis]